MSVGIKDRFSSIAGRWLAMPSAVKLIAMICIAVFIIQCVSERIMLIGEPLYLSAGAIFDHVFGLYWPIAAQGAFWQPVTYIFLHGSWMHLIMNMISLLSFGSMVENLLGERRFWFIFLLSGIIGGICWMLFDYFEPTMWWAIGSIPNQFCIDLAQRWAETRPYGISNMCVGASGGVFGLIGAFTALCPRHKIVFLLFYVIPVKLQTRFMAILFIVITLVGLFADFGNVAHIAHLFGGLTGYIIARRYKKMMF